LIKLCHEPFGDEQRPRGVGTGTAERDGQPVAGEVLPAGQVGVQALEYGRRQRDDVLTVAFDLESQHAVAAVLAELVDVGADQLGDAQPAQQQHGDDRRGTQGLRAGVGVGVGVGGRGRE
jgi:hypothetical protein